MNNLFQQIPKTSQRIVQFFRPLEVENRVMQLLNQPNTRLNFIEDWRKEIITTVFPSVRSWRCEKIIFQFWDQQKETTSLLKSISDIKFQVLTKLTISDCSIASVENLVRINLPVLKELITGGNNLSNLSIFRKTRWRNFQKLHMQNNRVAELFWLSSMKGKMEDLNLQYHLADMHQCFCVSVIAKLEGKLKEFQINSEHRIQEKKLSGVLERKNSGLKINTEDEMNLFD